MYDLNNKFNTFYRKHVVLPKEKKNDLFQKKNLNISRLKKGLEEYNEEHGTDYQLIDHVVQGSVAMSTVVQNEDNDYDIDVAIIFDKDKLPEGTRATKNIIVDALKRKCTGFKKSLKRKRIVFVSSIVKGIISILLFIEDIKMTMKIMSTNMVAVNGEEEILGRLRNGF